MHKQKGMVLILTCLFLCAIFLLSLHMLEAEFINNKQTRMLWQHRLLKNASRHFYQTFSNVSPSCVIAGLPLLSLKSFPDKWWQQHACTANFSPFQYRFVIEDLGRDDCALILNAGDKVAEYFRLTLQVFVAEESYAKYMTQAIFVKAALPASACQNNRRFVAAGLSQIFVID